MRSLSWWVEEPGAARPRKPIPAKQLQAQLHQNTGLLVLQISPEFFRKVFKCAWMGFTLSFSFVPILLMGERPSLDDFQF